MSIVTDCMHPDAEPYTLYGRTLCARCATGNGQIRLASVDEKNALRTAITGMRIVNALEHTNWFNTVEAVAWASDQDLALVANLGPITIRRIRRAIPQKPAPPWTMHATLPTVPVDQALTDAQLPILAEHIADALVDRLADLLIERLAQLVPNAARK